MFEKFLKESFDSHLKIAKKIIKEEKSIKNKFYKFGFFDFDDTLYENEGNYIIEDTSQYRKIVELLEDPEPCYIGIITARRSDTKEIVIRIDPRYFRPTEVEELMGDSTKAHQKLGWSPTFSLEELVTEMVIKDKEDALKESILIKKGFKVKGSLESPPAN